jgi:hypothetical protein
MTYIGVESTAYQVEKRSWLLSQHGTDPGTNPNIVLDVSTFTAATHYPNGYLLSGIVLGIITATSNANVTVVGPYDDSLATGQQVAAGILFSSVKVPSLTDTTKDPGGAMVVHGFVKRSKLPIANGATGRGYIDTAGETDLKLIHFSA